jgi:hypothetical protein
MTKPRRPNRARKSEPASFEMVRQIALALPGVEEATTYGTPGFKVRGKFLARISEDGESLIIKAEFAAREVLTGADPDTFFVPDCYGWYPVMLVRLSRAKVDDLRDLLEEAWRNLAPRRLVLAREASRGA